jgi:hypothetical protein
MSKDVSGHAADVWESKRHDYLSCPGATVMILPMTDDLCAAHLMRGSFGLLRLAFGAR